MPVTLKQVMDHVVAMDEPGLPRPASIAGAVRETIAALGLEVNQQTGEVCDPAAGARAPRNDVVPRNDRGFYVRGVRRRG